MKRPTINIGMFAAPAWMAQPKHETVEPKAMERFRPSLSPVNMMMIVPRMAPPWNEETMPPVTVSLGDEKYVMKCGCEMVEVMIPLS